jgi:isoquinoline 1-oxidoreductase beta subunit
MFWSGSQFPSIDLFVTANVLGIKPEQVKINILISGGSFGRRAVPNADWTFELAAVAKASGRKEPIQLVWTREDDIKGGYYRPMFLHAVEAGVTADGKIAGWRHKVIGKSIMIGTALEAMVVHDGVDDTSVEGVKNSPYKIPHFAVEAYNPTSEVPVLWWRSVGNTHTAQVMETMMDELATLAGRDAVAFRLELLSEHPRMADVLKLAAEKGDWGQPMPAGRGRGIAVHESFGTRVAMVAEVTVDGADIKVDRIVAAVDCGIAVNPDIIAAQVEGSVGFALSSVLRNAITLTDGVVDQSNFDGFEPTRMSEMPKVEVHIAKVDAPPSGIGEPAVPLLAPAIGNAVFQATGKRLRSLPFDLGTVG